MTLGYTKSALVSLSKVPKPVRKAFYKQVGFLVRDLQHPSLRAKKYDEATGCWQARVNRNLAFLLPGYR